MSGEEKGGPPERGVTTVEIWCALARPIFGADELRELIRGLERLAEEKEAAS